jgi:glycosyltransferase involved in cell wall biosynthesis
MNSRVVSTIIPCYNHGALLARAVESVMSCRDELGREIIVVDDGSTDDTPAVCAKLMRTFPSVRTIRQPNRGLSSARNAGIRAASGDLVHFLDADDYVDGSIYSALAAVLPSQGEAHVAYSGFEIIDRAGGQNCKSEGETAPADMRERLLRGNIGPVHSFVVRREAIDAAGFFDESLTSCEDWDYWLRIATLGYLFVHVPKILAYYERQSASMSRNYPAMMRNAKAVLAKAAESGTQTPRDEAVDAANLATMRRSLFDASYAGMLEGYLCGGHFGFVAAETLRLFRADPDSGWMMLSLLSHHKRAMLGGIRAVVARAVSPFSKREPR